MSRLVTFRPSPNFDDRQLPVSILVLHYTGMPRASDALDRLCDPEAKVSAHWFIDEDGSTTQLVAENSRAWHAGRSFWRGISDVNSASIGIELQNPGHEWGYRCFPRRQMQACLDLVSEILGRHAIPLANVVGHSDIAPARKEDPGELFDWPLLARHGLALATPRPLAPAPDWTAQETADALAAFGYDTSNLEATLRAFQRRFRPDRVDGVADAETRGILAALLAEGPALPPTA
jgi:N-acetylmuramoyl-L-alanine amidase